MKKGNGKTAYDVITARIIEELEKGNVPWNKPWNIKVGAPKSLVSKKPYRGINLFILGFDNYESPYWLTYNQAKKLGGIVKKGEKGTPVVFWKFLEKEDAAGEAYTIPFLRYYTVFNVGQCENLDESKIPEVAKEEIDFNPIEKCEEVVAGYKNAPTIEHGKTRAYYSSSTDTVNLPRPELFKGDEAYYGTFFHELVHSTGHTSRLDRGSIVEAQSFGNEEYSKEELVAEIGATYLCGYAGIENTTIENSGAYIKHWLGVLKEDNKLIIKVAGLAQKATDRILGVEFKKDKK